MKHAGKILNYSNIHLRKILEKFSVINYRPSSYGFGIDFLVHFSFLCRIELQYFMNIAKNIALERQKPHTASDIEINYPQSCLGFRHCNRPRKI